MLNKKGTLLVLALFISACDIFTYKHDKTNFVEVDSEPGNLEIFWETLPDTLVIWDELTINYDIKIDVDIRSLDVYLLIDDQPVATNRAGDPIVWDSRKTSNGIKKATLSAVARTGTGSLGDNIGVEKSISFTDSKYFWVSNGMLSMVRELEFTLLENGALKLEWEEYNQPRVKGYSVMESTTCPPGCERVYLDSPDSTSWIDYNYDGRDRTYSIKTIDFRSGGDVEGRNATFSTNVTPTELINVETTGNSETKFTWERNRFPYSFYSYNIASKENHGNYVTIAEVDDIDQTEAIIPTPLGTWDYFHFYSKSVSQYGNTTKIDTVKVRVGKLFDEDITNIRLLKYDEATQTYFLSSESHIYLFDANTLEMILSKEIVYSSFYTHSETRNQFVITFDSIVQIFDTTTLQLVKEIDLRNLYPDLEMPLISQLRLDNGGMLWYSRGYRIGNSSYYSRGLGAYNIETNTLLSNFHTNTHGDGYGTIHPDREYFIARIQSISSDPSIYRVTSENSFMFHYTPAISRPVNFIDDGSRYFGFNGQFTELHVRTTADDVEIWKISLPPDFKSFNHNVTRNKFSYISESEGGLIIRSFDNGSIIETIDHAKVALDQNYQPVKDVIFLYNGLYEKRSQLLE